MYMAQLQQLSPDATDSGPIFDDESLQKVSNNDHYNVFAIERTHPEQSKFVLDTYPIEQDAQNVIIDSLDMSDDREEIDQNDDSTLSKAVRMAHTLMEHKVKAKTEREADNKKRKWENFQGGSSSGGGNNNSNRNNNNYNSNRNYNNNRNNNQNQYRNPNRNYQNNQTQGSARAMTNVGNQNTNDAGQNVKCNSFTDALILMPKFASTLKALIGNKEKLSEMARTPMNEHCSAVILNKLPKKLGDPGKFLIPCGFLGMDECLALADLGASINLMPLSVWKELSLLELTLTCMTLELADRSVSKPIDIAKDVKVKVGMFHFPADFMVVDFKPDPRVPLILGRCFLKTGHALIDVHKRELTLRIRNEAITYNLDQTSIYSANYDQMTANKIDVTNEAYEEYFQEVLGFSNVTASGSPTPSDDLIVSPTSPTLTPFEDSDFLLFEEANAFLTILNSDPAPSLPNHEQSVPSFTNELKACEAKTIKSSVDEPPTDFLLEEVDAFLAVEDEPTSSDYYQPYLDPEGDILLLEAFLNDDPSPPPYQGYYMPEACEAKTIKSSVDEPPEVELKDLPPHLEYAFLEGDNKLPVIITKELGKEEKAALIKILKSHKRAIAWKLSDIQ
nr:reverse transcriptase domain-containing protein [Tanacetum cinerariifolium]